MNSFYNDPAVELDPKFQRNLKLNWDDIQSIQDLYGAPKSSKTNRKQFREENVKGPYSAAVTISPSRIMVKRSKNSHEIALVSTLISTFRLFKENMVLPDYQEEH